MAHPWRIAAGSALIACGLLTACGGSSPPPDPQTLLHDAKQSLDSAHDVHFHIESSNTPKNAGTYIISGDGLAARPNQFSGTISLSANGFPLAVSMVATNGKFWIQLPFQSSWIQADPKQYGFNDPGLLLDPNQGLTSLLIDPTNIKMLDRDRYQGEELDEVQAGANGQRVTQIITGGDSSATFTVTYGLDVDTHQLRRVVITGPLVVKGQNSTYTCIFTDYNQNVSVTPPA
jgi:lipoprotein LprG